MGARTPRHFAGWMNVIPPPRGRAIIELCYVWSPAMVQAMKAVAALKEEVKKAMDNVLLPK